MANNNRIYYAIEAVGMAQLGSTSYTAIHGLQSAGITTNFTLQQVSEIGQAAVYENVEILPEIEVTTEKALDGYCPLLLQATNGATAANLQARALIRTSLALSTYGDSQQSASGVPIGEIECSGLYWSNSNFNLTVEGIQKESLTFVGNNKKSINVAGGGSATFSPTFTNADSPFALTSGSGGVQRRRDVIFYPILSGSGYAATKEQGTTLDDNGQLIAFFTILPPDIDGISSSGTNDRDSNGAFGAHLQSINVTCGLTRENEFELGRQDPFNKYPQTPVQVTSDIEIIGTKWDNVSALAEGVLTGVNAGFNLVNRTIKVRMREGLWIDLGTKNKLSNLTWSGGGTDGANVMVRYSYQTYNDYTVTHPQDPSAIVWPY